MIVILPSPLVSYLSYEIMASDGWLEGYFIGKQTSHQRIEEGTLVSDSLMNAVRITSFTRVGSHTPGFVDPSSSIVGWFRYRNGSARRLSMRETSYTTKQCRKNPNFVFCLASRELKGDVTLTMALNFAFYTVSPADSLNRNATIKALQLIIANPDDSLQPDYPCFQIDHAFTVPWMVPEGANADRDSKGRPKSRSPPSDPSQQLVEYTKNSYQKMLVRLTEVGSKVLRHDSLMTFD